MFPAHEMMFAAEIDYRRERMMAVRPKRRRERHVRVPRQRRGTEPDRDGAAAEPATSSPAASAPALPTADRRRWDRAA
ncbi:MAG: hypothetical protein ACOYX5_14185 [Actinomycetota bacterium]